MLTLEEMFTPMTKDEILEGMLTLADSLGFPTSAWQPGSVAREILEICAQQLANTSEVVASVAAGGLVDYATSGWLTLLAKSFYNLDRIEATFGTGSVTLTNSSGVGYVIAANDIHFLNSTTGATYTNTTGGSLGAGGTLTLDIIADEAGSASNAVATQINALVTPLLGVTVTNPAALTASDAESDDQLRARCRASLAAASPNGPSDAYNYFATSSVRENGSSVGITRSRVDETQGDVTVYVATDSGAVPGSAGDPTTDLGAVNANIQANCVPTGITATIATAVAAPITVAGDAWLKTGSTIAPAALQALILAKLQTYWKTIPIGGFDIGSGGEIFLDAIIGQVFQAHPDIIQVTISSPVVDIALNPFDVSTLTSVLGSFTIHST
jgi:uncharacterized phage protein gp47/JayE